MPKFGTLLRGVFGLSRRATLDGRAFPDSLRGCTPVVVVHDRRLSAGIFALSRKRRKSGKLYRIVAWRTYRDKKGTECASTALYRDELDPVLRLIQQCVERMPNE